MGSTIRSRMSLIFIGFMALFLTTACENTTVTAFSVGPGGGGGGSPSIVPFPTILALDVRTAYQTTPTDFVSQGMCIIPAETAEGFVLACTVTIPEARMFYSRLQFVIEGEPGICDVVEFLPYFYQASAERLFEPDWRTTGMIDCSLPFEDLATDCFNGIAPSLVPGFPDNVGLFFLPMADRTTTLTMTQSAQEADRLNNRFTSNTLAQPSRGLNLGFTGDTFVGESGEGYVGFSMQDYTVVCRDVWDQPNYTIALTIVDEDDEGPFNSPNDTDFNHRADWNSTNGLDPFVVVSLTACGNGSVNLTHGEECDAGLGNSDVTPDACRTNCMFGICGDFVTDPANAEECDDGTANSNSVPDACRVSCVDAFCGDGVIDTGEACDDGNIINGDGCSATCTIEP